MATFSPIPIIPEELINAAQAGELVVFIGAGVSKLVSGPSWDEFADAVLSQLVQSGKIDYFTLSQIQTIADPRKRLSIANIISKKGKYTIDYSTIFRGAAETPNIYSHLNALNCSFVTTNYDRYLAPECHKNRPEDDWRYYRRDHLLASRLDRTGNVLHLHGCIKEGKRKAKAIASRYLEHDNDEVRRMLLDLTGDAAPPIVEG